ncbi:MULTISPECIES: hypothetical protein [unclassified Xanthobacter]|uniref:hypothetical protein n=1 Tax=unclassified Xanthobacter TaxID=2623496 RepID=UPI001EE0FA01|nr:MULTISPECIES: hypothetical protein [unclassified Xanthobacter]
MMTALTRWRTRRWLRMLALVILAGAAAVVTHQAIRLITHMRDNRTILGLAAGRDLAVADDAAPRLLFARAHFLMTHDQLNDAQHVVDVITRSDDTAMAAAALYDLGNTRLARAIDLLERMAVDAAIPEIRLAKENYRATLRHAPSLWDAKYNLDIALRLIRDFPEIERELEEEPRQTPKRLWTDLPGLPKGLP